MEGVEIYCLYAQIKCGYLDNSVYPNIELYVCTDDESGCRYIVDGGEPGYGPIIIRAPQWCNKRKIVPPSLKDKMKEEYWVIKK